MSTRATTPSWLGLLMQDVRCVRDRDPAARSLAEVLTIYPGVQAIALHRLAHALWRRGWRYLPRWLSFMARLMTQIDIHPGARIGCRFFIDHGTGVVIGETAEIGDDVTLYHGVTLGGTSWRAGKRHPTVGSQVVIGAGAKILGPIVVGDRARVAANSVVIDTVPPGATVVGIPGRVVVRGRSTNIRHGIDLDHHLMPDPVGKAIACLLDRIAALEAAQRVRLGLNGEPETDCGHCADACTEPTFGAAATHPDDTPLRSTQ